MKETGRVNHLRHSVPRALGVVPGPAEGMLFGVSKIIIIKGHSLLRACPQPATNTQNSKLRPPTQTQEGKEN